MKAVLNFIEDYFDINTYLLGLIAIVTLLFIDRKIYKRKGLNRERKFSTFFAYLYIFIFIGTFILSRIFNY